VKKTGAIVLVLLVAGVSSAVAQRRGFGGGGFGNRGRREAIQPNVPYDGQFTFVRVRYGPDYGFAGQSLPW
jgi:hypothetical protein